MTSLHQRGTKVTITEFRHLINLKVIAGRDALTGRMDYRLAGLGGGSAIRNLAYVWDNAGNLTQRGDANQPGSCSVGGLGGKLCETFSYDNLDRLDTVRRNGTLTLDVNYDLSGNVTSRSDVGSYTYHATKKHAVTTAGSNTYAYDANGNVQTRNGATLGWKSYDLPSLLVSAGGAYTQLSYAPDRSRYWQSGSTSAGTESTVYVAGILEKVTRGRSDTLWKHYVTTPTGMGAVYVRRSDGTSDTYYVTTDHLGSTDRILKAASGTVQVAESFAPFGARRGSDWQGAPSAADLTAIGNSTPDGFTGHEMLDGVGLIHMRGRVYDPTVGRFLSVDPLVRDAGASQSWNGYGYVEGRMLSARDPSGWSTEEIVVSATRDGGPGLRSNVNFGLDSYFRQLRAAPPWTPGAVSRGAGQGGSDCPPGLEEVVVDGQRGQPSVPVVSLTFVPLSITPPNSARFSRLLNAAEAEHQRCVSNCKAIGNAVTTIAANASAGAAAGLIQGNVPLAGWLAGAGAVAGVIQVATQPPKGASNATQVASGVAVGAVVGAAVRGGTSISGGIAGGAVGGLFSMAGAPNFVAGGQAGIWAGLGARGGSLSRIGGNIFRGGIAGIAAGAFGDLVGFGGQAITNAACESWCSR